MVEDRYRICSEIGTGGSSRVYQARDEMLGRDVAIKVLDARAAADASLRGSFVREAQALAKLSHPNIVAVHDVGELDGLPFIVMDHVPGSLKDRIDRSGPLPLGTALAIAEEVAAGLAFAHSRGIVHADLKPSNILLGEEGHAQICDFGIARALDDASDTRRLVGTARYVAPERVEGRPASSAADIYGLGLVLYEMLVGRPPFTSPEPAVLMTDHLVREPVPPSHLRMSLPRDVDRLVLRALAKDPAARHGSARELASDIAAVRARAGLLAHRATEPVMTAPLQGIRPGGGESPVVALIQSHQVAIRRTFFSVLAALLPFALLRLAAFDLLPATLAAVLVIVVGLAGLLGAAVALSWVMATVAFFLFAPGLALVFALVGVWLWLRDVSPERTALALATPVAAPFGLGPVVIFLAATVHGLGGVLVATWGAVLTVVMSLAFGRSALGPYVLTGLGLEPPSLFDPQRAAAMQGALIAALSPGTRDRFAALAALLDPRIIFDQMGMLLSRLAGADLAAIATVLAWAIAGLVVWTVTRLLRGAADTLLGPRRSFALYLSSTAMGIGAGAAVLYMLFASWAPLALGMGRHSDGVLLSAAVVGAAIALPLAVILAATAPLEADDEVEALPEGSAG